MADLHLILPHNLQKAATHTFLYEAADTSETVTIFVSKGGADFITAAVASTVAQVDEFAFRFTVGTDDVSDAGDVAWKTVASGGTTYIYGCRVVEHDPEADVRLMRQTLAGKVVVDTSAGTITIYAADGVTQLAELTRSETGDTVTWTPS